MANKEEIQKLIEEFPFEPFNDMVVVLEDKAVGVSAGGIIIPDEAQTPLQTGTVIAVGPGGILPDGTRAKMSARPGQPIYIKKFVGHKMKILDVDFLVMNEEHILGGLTEAYQEKMATEKAKKEEALASLPDIREAKGLVAR